MSHLPAVFLALIWMWSDTIGTLLSVISTYFYFGWEGTPALVPKIFALVLLAFSSPIVYRLLFYKIDPRLFSRGSLGLLFVTYTSLSFNRSSDFFAWGTIAACWLGGITLMGVLRQMRQFSQDMLWLYTLQIAFFLYLGTRAAQAGLPLVLLAPQGVGWIAWAMLTFITLLGLFLPHYESVEKTEATSKPTFVSGSLGIVFGLLMGMSVGIIENVHIWSARTPNSPGSIYFLSLGSGAFLGRVLYLLKIPAVLRVIIAGLSTGIGIYGLLYFDISGFSNTTQLLLSLGIHFAGALGLTTLWSFFLKRFASYQEQHPTYFPWAGLQTGFIGLLLILAIFLLKANPIGFWAALGISVILLGTHEALAPIALDLFQPKKYQRTWNAACTLIALLGILSLGAPTPMAPENKLNNSAIEVMSTNIRYGWTDDYRFAPLEHMRYLKARTPHIMGVQEVNKGHTSGAYSDIFRLYQQALPGQWFYGDANFGFGNALLSRYPVLHSENRVYTAKDMLKRSCLINTLKINDKEVTVLVTHVSHLTAPNPVRQAQIKELSGWIKSLKTPWILIGDFNATPDSTEIKQLIKLSHNVYQQDPEWLSTYSFPSVAPDRRIDYIFFSQDFTLDSMEILDNHGTTDHRPVLAKLRL